MRRPVLACLVAAASSVSVIGEPAASIRCGIEMRNVSLRVADAVVLQIASLDGEFISQSAPAPPVFDNPRSYVLRMKQADLSLDAASLTALLRQSLPAKSSPISDVTVTIESGGLHAKGKLHKGVTVPFSMDATVGTTADGLLRLHATKVKAAGVPIKGLLDLIGVEVGDLMKMPPGSGLRADGDDLLMDTTALMPPPRMEGRLRGVEVSGSRLRMRMAGSAAPPARPSTLPLPSARNYLYFYGGSITFGKLTMKDADMQLIDADPSTPFDFYPARYEDQLVAGYSRNTRRKGLQVFMPDYGRLRRLTPPAEGSATPSPR